MDHEQTIEDFIVSKKEYEKIRLRASKKAKISSKNNRVLSVPKILMGSIKKKFQAANNRAHQMFQGFHDKREDDIKTVEAPPRSFSYDANIDELIKSFSENLKNQQEEKARQEKLKLKAEKKQKVSRRNARVALSPKLLMNKIKKKFNKAKIAVMSKINAASYKYAEYKDAKAYELDQEMGEILQEDMEEERVKQRKADFKEALKEQKKEQKLKLREERKVTINSAKSSVTVIPFILTNLVKKNFNKAKIAIMGKINAVSSLSYLFSASKEQMSKISEGITSAGLGTKNKYGKLYSELMNQKEERQAIKAEKKAAKKDDRKARHDRIMEMIKTLDDEQQKELAEQQAQISSLQSEIMYNISEAGERKR